MGIELAAMAAATAAKAYMGAKSAHDAEGAERAAIAQQAADRAKAEALVHTDIGALRTSNPDADRAALQSDFVNQLRANSGRTDASTPAVNGANVRYGQDVKANNTAADAHTQKFANFISAIRAAQNQRQHESMRMNDTATALGGVQQDTGQDMATAGLNINKAAQPNPWLAYGTQLVGNLASSNVFGPKVMVPGSETGVDLSTVPSGASSATGNTPWSTSFFKG